MKVTQLCLTLWPYGLYSPWNSPGQNTGVGRLSLLQGIFPTQGSNPGPLHCRGILYQLSYQGKPKNTGVGSLFFLTQIFLTQESNHGLPHCRWILYQLSYQGKCKINVHKTVFLIFFKYWTKAELALSYLVPSQCYVRGFENWKAFINYAISSRFSIKHKFHI